MEQIAYCQKQIARFSNMFRTNTIDSKERHLQFGYTLGRLIVLLNKTGQIYKPRPVLNSYTIGMAKAVIYQGLQVPCLEDFDDPYPENFQCFERTIIDFGFAIGFIQETLEQSHHYWWKPIAGLAAEEKWDEVVFHIQRKPDLVKINDMADNYIIVFPGEDSIDWADAYQKIVDSYDASYVAS